MCVILNIHPPNGKTLELLGIVETLAHRIGQTGVPVQHVEVQLLRPPVTVGLGGVHHRAFARALVVSFCVHVTSPRAFCPLLYKDRYGLESEPSSWLSR